MNLTTEKPILFNTAMVQTILEGRKTSTRRIIKNLSIKDWEATLKNGEKYKRYTLTNVDRYGNESEDFWFDGPIEDIAHDKDIIAYAPYKVGDVLYVRETWCSATDGTYRYKASIKEDTEKIRKAFGVKWHPSIHMPKKAARLFLKVTDVKVQRLQDITEREILREGIRRYHFNMNMPDAYGDNLYTNPKLAFEALWDSCGYKECNSWSGNPWVWVIEFKIEKVKK